MRRVLFFAVLLASAASCGSVGSNARVSLRFCESIQITAGGTDTCLGVQNRGPGSVSITRLGWLTSSEPLVLAPGYEALIPTTRPSRFRLANRSEDSVDLDVTTCFPLAIDEPLVRRLGALDRPKVESVESDAAGD